MAHVACVSGMQAVCGPLSGRSPSATGLGSLHRPQRLRRQAALPSPASLVASQRSRVGGARAEVSVELGGEKEHVKAKAGDKLKVVKSVKVYHVPKVPDLDLEGQEGVLKEVLGEWKGVAVSANLPYKAQFELELDGAKVKFFAHLKEDEFDVL